MNRKEILDQLKKKKVQDYSLTIIFFVIFSFFLAFAIRPNILTAFNLEKELTELRAQDRQFEQIIARIVDYQTVLETNRDNFYLLDEAVPPVPQIAKVTDDLRKSASESGVITHNLQITEIDLKKEKPEVKGDMKSYEITMDTTADIVRLKAFIDHFMNQRRLKSLKVIEIAQDQSTTEPVFQVNLIIDGYYL